MAKYKCPSCGASYNGQKCRQCLYEHFSEEIAHGNHTHTGEPLVIHAPVRKPTRRKDPFGCDKKTRKKRPLAGFLILLAVLNSLLPLLRDWGLELESREENHIAAEPEPESFLPEDALLLWEEGSIRLYADWEGRSPDNDYFDIYVENDHNYDLVVVSQDVVVNGYVMEYSGVYLDAYQNSTSRSTFYFDGTELEDACIDDVQEVSFRLEVYDEDYTTLFITDPIIMPGSSDYAGSSAISGGTPVFAQEDIEIRYLGYSPDIYDPEDISQGNLLFYLENNTDRTLQFYTSPATVADGLTELFLYKELPPQTKAVVRMYLWELEDAGIQSLAEMTPMTVRLEIYDINDPDFLISTDPVTLPLE